MPVCAFSRMNSCGYLWAISAFEESLWLFMLTFCLSSGNKLWG